MTNLTDDYLARCKQIMAAELEDALTDAAHRIVDDKVKKWIEETTIMINRVVNGNLEIVIRDKNDKT